VNGQRFYGCFFKTFAVPFQQPAAHVLVFKNEFMNVNALLVEDLFIFIGQGAAGFNPSESVFRAGFLIEVRPDFLAAGTGDQKQ
jgi:hypothetical protein